jgi:hypothetical protein
MLENQGLHIEKYEKERSKYIQLKEQENKVAAVRLYVYF